MTQLYIIRKLLLIAIVMASLSAMANINATSRLRLRALEQVPTSRDNDTLPPYRPMILMVSNDLTVDSIEAMGGIIYHRRDDMLLTSVPSEFVDSVLNLDGLISAAVSSQACIQLDKARPFGRVNSMIDGTPSIAPYDGKGVVIGFSDIGFDPHHIAFEDKIKALYNYDTAYGIRQQATTDPEIRAWTTDDADNYHATHVGNIMGGHYYGNNYYGVATGAEMVATTSKLNDVGILSGVEDIIAYAGDQGKRAVINLSLSSYLGPHDGTDLLCRYLSACAEEAVICISAGNNGRVNGYCHHDLAVSDAKFIVNDKPTWTGFEVSGYVDVWSQDSIPFEYAVGVYDNDQEQVVYLSPWATVDESLSINDVDDPQWGQYMHGRILSDCNLDVLNNRYNMAIAYETSTQEKSNRGAWARYFTYITIRRLDDDTTTSIDVFADGVSSFIGGVANGTKPSTDCSINNMCTADGVISVGMAVSRNEVPIVDAQPITWADVVGTINLNSSYSNIPGIKRLPVISAPGQVLISAMSSEYMTNHPETPISDITHIGDHDYYWYAAGGTSMASPFVAGVIAAWLQADPTLTGAQIVDIIKATAQTDYTDISNPRWGAGCIDAEAGLQRILDQNGINDIESVADISIDNNGYITSGSIPIDKISIYTLSGIQLNPTSKLSKGVYIVRIPGLPIRKIARL